MPSASRPRWSPTTPANLPTLKGCNWTTGSSKDPYGNVRSGFEGETTINRKDYGIVWNAALETGGVLVSEKVTLDIEISAILQP